MFSGHLFSFFNADRPVIAANFKDTPAALEIKMGECCDSVLLLDDFHPALTRKEKAEMDNVLERIVRFYGDNVSKSRSTSTLERQKEFLPHGLCAITGEDTAGTQSSLLRCVLIEVGSNDYNGALLKNYQSNPLLWSTHIYHFVTTIGRNYNPIVTKIKQEFELLRQKYCTSFQTKRLVDSAVCLMLVTDIFLQYAVTQNVYKELLLNNIYKNVKK